MYCYSPHLSQCAQLLSRVQLFLTLWTIAYQASLSMGFPRQEYWSGLPFPPPEDLPNPEIKATSPAPPALAGEFSTTLPLGKPTSQYVQTNESILTHYYSLMSALYLDFLSFHPWSFSCPRSHLKYHMILVVMCPQAPLSCNSFLNFFLFQMTVTVQRLIDQVFCTQTEVYPMCCHDYTGAIGFQEEDHRIEFSSRHGISRMRTTNIT